MTRQEAVLLLLSLGFEKFNPTAGVVQVEHEDVDIDFEPASTQAHERIIMNPSGENDFVYFVLGERTIVFMNDEYYRKYEVVDLEQHGFKPLFKKVAVN